MPLEDRRLLAVNKSENPKAPSWTGMLIDSTGHSCGIRPTPLFTETRRA